MIQLSKSQEIGVPRGAGSEPGLCVRSPVNPICHRDGMWKADNQPREGGVGDKLLTLLSSQPLRTKAEFSHLTLRRQDLI